MNKTKTSAQDYDDEILEATYCEICGLFIDNNEFRSFCEICGIEYGNCCACEVEDLNYCYECEVATRDQA